MLTGHVFTMMKTGISQYCQPDEASAAVYLKKLSDYYQAADKEKMAFGGTAKTMIIKFESPKNSVHEFAVKVFKYNDAPDIPEEDKVEKYDVESEVFHLENLKDLPELTKYYGCYMIQDKNYVTIFMVFEKLAGEIMDEVVRKDSNQIGQGESTPKNKVLTRANSGSAKTPAQAFSAQIPAVKCEIFASLAHQLSLIHSKGLAHNDIKPSNIMLVKPDGKAAKIIDFGATNTDKEEIGLFTFPYADFELRSFYEGSCENDVFALGLTIGEIVVGENLALSTFEDQKKKVSKPIDLIRKQIKALLDQVASEKFKSWTMKFGEASLHTLLSKMTNPMRAERPDAQCVEQWFTLLSKLFAKPNATDIEAKQELAKICPELAKLVI